MAFSLEKFESLAYSRNREMGMRELLALLHDLDEHYGNVGAQFSALPLQSVSERELNQHIWTRAAAAACPSARGAARTCRARAGARGGRPC